MKTKITSGLQFAILGALSSWAIFMLCCTVDTIQVFQERIMPTDFFDGQTNGIFYCLKILSLNYFPIFLSVFIISMALLLYLTIKRSGVIDFFKNENSEIFDSIKASSAYSNLYCILIYTAFMTLCILYTITSLQQVGELKFNINTSTYVIAVLALVGISSILAILIIFIAQKRYSESNTSDKSFKTSLLFSILTLLYPLAFLRLLLFSGLRGLFLPFYNNPYQIIVFMAIATLFCFIIGATIKGGQNYKLKSGIALLVLYTFTIGIHAADVISNNNITKTIMDSRIINVLSLEQGKGTPIKLLILNDGNNSKQAFNIINDAQETFYNDNSRQKINTFLTEGTNSKLQLQDARSFIVMEKIKSGNINQVLQFLKEETEKDHRVYDSLNFHNTFYYTSSMADILLSNLYDESFKPYADYITDPTLFISSDDKKNAKLRVIAKKYGFEKRSQYYKDNAEKYTKNKSEYEAEYKRLNKIAPQQSEGIIKGKILYNGKGVDGIKVGLLILKNRFDDNIYSEAKILAEDWLQYVYDKQEGRTFTAKVYYSLKAINNSKIVETDENGNFVFKNTDKGDYLLYLMLEGDNTKLSAKTNVGFIKSEDNEQNIKDIVLE